MRKRTSFILALLGMALILGAQVPQKFNYQAVVRNSQHALLSNQDVGFKMTVLKGSAVGQSVYVETHQVTTTNLGVADLMIGNGSVISGDFQDIQWGDDTYFLKVEADPSGGSAYEHLGTSQLISVPYALYSGNISSPTRKFTIQEETGHPGDSALFEVRNAEGQTVFAVYPEGTRVYILDEDSKGVKGGFAIGGYRRGAKGMTNEYMRITPDSIRLYVDENTTKGVNGGFAIGGYGQAAQGGIDHYFVVKPDSAKFQLVSDQPADAINNALTVTTMSTADGENGISRSLFNLTRNNYYIGHRAGESITDGAQNCFFGYESGANTTSGYGNIFIGEKSGNSNTLGSFNSFIGFEAGKLNLEGESNVCVGFHAGEANQTGDYNVYIGSDAGLSALGRDNVYLGFGSGANNKRGNSNICIGSASGNNADTSESNIFIGNSSGFNNSGGHSNVFLGNNTGVDNSGGSSNVFVGQSSGNFNTEGTDNTFIGAFAGQRNTDGINNVFVGRGAGTNQVQGTDNVLIGTDAGEKNTTGYSNVYIGASAGANNLNGQDNIFIGSHAGLNEPGSGKLYINNNDYSPENALIYGEFYNNMLRVNQRLGIGRMANTHALEVEGEVSKTSVGDWLANSDARIKTDVMDIRNAREQILSLHPVRFRYTEEYMILNPSVQDKEYYNFIAQEFQEVFPEAVRRGGDNLGEGDNLLQMDSYPAQVVAIKAIQELIQENREQQQIIEQLQQTLSQLLERFSAQGL
ncbi:MAG: tail fiber domain-containing protein [Bacteroidales bacterium]|nr:tail fiber domain-containing protein [Bacteroidales bacterium]